MLKLKNWIIVLKPFKNTFISSKTTLKTTSTSKSIRKPIFRLFRGIIVLELAFLAGGYVVWKRMNESQEFRFYMKENWPTILEGILIAIFF
jgi:hypothetical protein